MSLHRLSNAPLAEQVRTEILRAIIEKDFSERLPAEDVLASMLNVSRTTIRTALHSLEQEGIITRRRAIGTTINAHVRPSTLALQRLVGFDGLLREKGYEVEVEVEATRGPVPADLAATFDLAPDLEVLRLDKRYYADKALAISIRDALPIDELHTTEIEPPIPPSMFEFTQRYAHRPIDHAVVEILAVVKRDADSTRLELDVGEAFTRLHERHYDSNGAFVAASIIDVDNSFVRFEVFRRQ